MSSYDPSDFSDEELIDVLWSIDAQQYPDRYELICNEFAARFPGEPIPSADEQLIQKHEREIATLGILRIEVFRFTFLGVAIFMSAASLFAYFQACGSDGW